jgi:PAS domain S-box-containing protein
MLFGTAITLFIAMGAILLLLRRCARQKQTLHERNTHLSEQVDRLKESERRQDLLFKANPYPMWIYDCHTLGILSVNDAAVQAYGYSRDEFLAMTLLDIRPEEDGPAFLEMIKADQDAFSRPGVWRHRRKDGSVIFVHIMGCTFINGERPQRLVVALDVTERCRMEEALRDSQAWLQTMVDNAPFGIAQSWLDDDHFRTVNPALLHMLGGYTREEALQLSFHQQIYADARERDRLVEIAQRTGRINGWEVNFKKRDGTTVPVRITGSITDSKRGSRKLFSSYIEDLTQQSALEQQIRQVQKLEAVGRLAGGMAHDFNNILVVIKLSTEMLLAQVTPDHAFTKSLLQISNATDRAAALTKQMLAFGRQQMMQPRIISLNSVVIDTTHLLQRVIGEDVELSTHLAESLENCKLDPDQVTQVIMNLAVNARDAMPQGGMLHIETKNTTLDETYAKEHPPVQPGRYVMLAVSDTGSGIDRALIPRIFDPFFTTKEVGKGTGLGLSIVYGIVKQSGGYIWVYSEPGQGTTFKLYFPATAAPLDTTASRLESVSRPAGQTVLVVEDDPGIRDNVRDCLLQLGYHALVAESARAAMTVCDDLDGKIDLVLTDLVMAGRSGHELAHELAERYPNVRVLFMSGYTEDSATRRDILLKGSSFLQKPFSVVDLANAVHDALLLKVALM